MIGATTAAKYAPVVAPVLGAGVAVHADTFLKVAAVMGGLLLGGMWRAGSLVSEGQAWGKVRRDLFVSFLIGGANAILTLALVEWLQVGVMFAMALAVIVGATGLRALPELRDVLIGMARRKLLGDDVAVVVNPHDPGLDDVLAKLDELTQHRDR